MAFNCFYHRVNERRNGVGIILKERLIENVLEVKRMTDKIVKIKIEVEGALVNRVSALYSGVGNILVKNKNF